MTALNDFIKAYTKTDVEKGSLSFYTELAAEDGILDGYLKPVIEDLKIINWKKEKEAFLSKIWESIVGGITSLFKNHSKDQFATKTPVHGDLNNIDVGILPAIGNILKNAFIQAFSKQVDDTIDLSSVEKRK